MSSNTSYEALLKILLIGDAGSKKTDLLNGYTGGEMAGTVGLDYVLKDIVYQGKRVKLQLWDTAGQERFRSVTSSYYRGAHGCLLVFNAQNDSAFVGINYWLEEIKNNASSNFKIVMVATGIEDESTASNLVMARDYASGRNLPLIEVNLSTGTNVSESFDKIVEMAMAVHGKQQEINDSVHLGQSNHDSEKSACAC